MPRLSQDTFVLSLIQQADPNASAQTKAADLAMLTAIEQRIDAEFKGSPDQLLQLRVTVGDAYRNRGEMMAARRVFKRAIDEATPHIPQDDLRLLRARVQATDFNLIVSLESAADLDRIIEQLRPMEGEGADLLIDALMKREARCAAASASRRRRATKRSGIHWSRPTTLRPAISAKEVVSN